MNPGIAALHDYPFQRLSALLDGTQAPALTPVSLNLGEPQHPAPPFVIDALSANLETGLGRYPVSRGIPELRNAIGDWLCTRFRLGNINPDTQILPANGTREALFAFAQLVIEAGSGAHILFPNPFYQVYEGAALLAGAEPGYIPCSADSGFNPDFAAVSDAQWQRCRLLYLCSPGNPTGAVLSIAELQNLIRLADKHDFIIAGDECYSEIYPVAAEPPPGLLEAATAMGRTGFERCVVFHSLSKRSNVPGLRSGFVAGDAKLIDAFARYRSYHGCAMPLQHQHASIAAWRDEAHVADNRRLYQKKYDLFLDILKPVINIQRPPASFYLWPEVGGDDREFARALYAEQNVLVLPGSFLSREVDGSNPGAGRVRIALVPTLEDCELAAQRLRCFIESHA